MIRKRWFRRKKTTPSVQASSPERLVRVGCPAHNCGGRCLLVAHIQEDASGRRVITRLDTDDRPDTLAAPQLRACVRGRAYLRRQYHPDRLQYPMKRVGERGEGQFERMSWDEALDTVAVEMQRVKESYGNSALFVPYGTGSYNQINGSQTARRLMNLFGGCLGIYNSYSWAAINIATPTVYGTLHTGNQRQDWLNARLILMWGWNPAEMGDGTNSDYFVKLARERGARVVCIDPRHTLSAASLADEWVPIRPGTDTAMMSAMAYVMIVEHLYDADFVRTHCVGFDQSQMPEGAEGAESYRDYSLGSRDGIPKTPEWAEAITTVPRQTIVRIAREYATIKPSILYQGYGMQRRAYGEQVVRAGCVLAAITGNVGVPGGWASGLGLHPQGGPLWNVFPVGENPIEASIPVFLWSEAVLRGAEMGPEEGVIGVDRLDNNIKLIYAVATNALVNQHANINRSAKILRDESLVEFVAVQDNFLTPTGRFADVLLPACTQFETWGVEDGWKYGSEVILMPQLVEPLGESKSDYRICAELAERLGFGEAYTEGRSERAWVEWILDHYRKERFPDLPTLDEFEAINIGAYVEPADEPAIAFADFCADPDAHPLSTPSGKIEILSKQLYDMDKPEEIPAVPQISPGMGESIRAGGREIPTPSDGAPQHGTGTLDTRQRGLVAGSLSPTGFHERIGRQGTRDRRWRSGQGLQRAWGDDPPLPGDESHPPGSGEHPTGGLVDARRKGRGSEGVGERAHLGEMDATDLWHGTAHNHGGSQELGTMKQYTFYFDSSACSGCKACQMACKDRHGLKVGLLWRRVYEVVGGGWTRRGEAWNSSMFAYNVSLACNHCEKPICAEVCPTRAITRRADGIVLLDPERCVGCKYCSWACPYGAPQYDDEAGTMSKCTFCAEDLDVGLPPSCVAACPLRALDFGDRAELEERYGSLDAVYPLPEPSLTEPALVITPHQDATRAGHGSARVGNWEEVKAQ